MNNNIIMAIHLESEDTFAAAGGGSIILVNSCMGIDRRGLAWLAHRGSLSDGLSPPSNSSELSMPVHSFMLGLVALVPGRLSVPVPDNLNCYFLSSAGRRAPSKFRFYTVKT